MANGDLILDSGGSIYMSEPAPFSPPGGGDLRIDNGNNNCCCPPDCSIFPSAISAVSSGYPAGDCCDELNTTWTLYNTPGSCLWDSGPVTLANGGMGQLTVQCQGPCVGSISGQWTMVLADLSACGNVVGFGATFNGYRGNRGSGPPLGTYTLAGSGPGFVCPNLPATMTVVLS